MPAKVDLEKCTGCSMCLDSCPMGAIKMKNDKALVTDECVECGRCVQECPNSAISLE